MNEAEKFVLELKPYKGKRAYPETLRLNVGKYVVRCRNGNESWSAIQRKLGLGKNTIKNWAEKIPRDIQPIKIKHAVQSMEKVNAITITSPKGWKIEGLNFKKATLLLREIHR